MSPISRRRSLKRMGRKAKAAMQVKPKAAKAKAAAPTKGKAAKGKAKAATPVKPKATKAKAAAPVKAKATAAKTKAAADNDINEVNLSEQMKCPETWVRAVVSRRYGLE